MNMIATTLFIHVVLGSISLMTGLLVLILTKGTNLHAKLGWIYFASMSGVFLTSAIVSFTRNNLFLLLIGFFSLYLVQTGMRYRFIKSIHDIRFRDRLLAFLYGVIFVFLLGYATYALINRVNSFAIVLAVFGLIGMLLWKNDLKYILLQKSGKERLWLREHIGRMIGSYIAASTAFIVNNVRMEPAFIPWLAPTVILSPLIIYFTRKYIKE